MTENKADLWLEKLALGELTPAERARLDARLSPEEQAAALARLATDTEEHLRLNPPGRVAAEVMRRASVAGAAGIAGAAEPGVGSRQSAVGSRQQRSASAFTVGRRLQQAISASGRTLAGFRERRFWAPALGGACLVCATLFLVHVTSNRQGTGAGNEFTETVKGLPSNVKLYKKTGDGFAAMPDGDEAKAGDLLQLRYQAAGAPYGVIVSLDGRGEATLHYPSDPDETTALKQGGEIALDHAYELDDAPAFERFIFVTSDSPLTPRDILKAARNLAVHPGAGKDGLLALPSGTHQTDLLMRKAQ